MKLAGAQLVLDTNVLLHLLRGRDAGRIIEATYAVGQRTPRAIISIVSKGELKALAFKFGWSETQHERVNAMLAGLPAADLAHASVIDAYARLDVDSTAAGVKMGKNDLWIAATTQVLGGVLLTTDRDFDHLHPDAIQVERIAIESLRAG